MYCTMRKLRLFMSVVIGLSFLTLSAQNLKLSLPDTTTRNGDTLRIQMTTADFFEMASFQFSLAWDSTVIQYLGFEFADLSGVAVGDTDASSGSLRMSWFDTEGQGATLPDGSSIAELVFLAIGEVGDQTDIPFVGEPLEIQIVRVGSEPGTFEQIMLEQDSGFVEIISPLLVSFSKTDVGCNASEAGAIDLTIDGDGIAFTLSWSGPDGFSSTEEDLDGLGAGDYTLVIQDDAGIVLVDSTITINAPENLLTISNINTMGASCVLQTGSAQVEITGGTAPFAFDIGMGRMDSGNFPNLTPGTYNVTVTDAQACTQVDSFVITGSEIPILELGNDIRICEGENTILDAGMQSEYMWSTGEATQSITVDKDGDYSVTVTSPSGCTSSDTVSVMLTTEVEVVIENDFMEVCQGETIELVVSGADNYLWIDTSNTLSNLNIANPVAAPNRSTLYQVIGSSSCGADTVDLEVFVLPVSASAGQDTCISPGFEVQLNASGGVGYVWLPSEYPVSNDVIPNPTSLPEDSTVYVVRIVEENGCTIIDSVTVLLANDPQLVKAINLITPNGDGKNDVLEFETIGKFGANTLKIYNRWGNLVYQKVNYQIDEERFDGTYKGKPLPTGNYFYILAFRNGEIKQTLTITRE